MSNSYNGTEIDETDRGLESAKNRDLAQPMSAIQRRRAALEELDEAKFSVCTPVVLPLYHPLLLVSVSIALSPVVVSSLTSSGSTLEHAWSLESGSSPTLTISLVSLLQQL